MLARLRTGMATLAAVATVPLCALLACTLAAALSPSAHGEAMWTTYHRDPARSGDDPEAGTPLAPSLAWQSPPLGAPIWGQPLVLGSRVYVATVGDRLYALEASSGKVIWEKSAGVPVPSSELPCGDISPTVGIVGTPVIDTSTNAIYAVADTWDASKKEAHHVLKGYALSGGEEVLSAPVDPPGSDPKALLQRTALNLDGGEVVFGFGGNDGDCGNYRGTVVAAPVGGGAAHFWQYQPAAPAFSGAGVWGPSGPAVDGEGNIYASTGNPNTSGGEAATYDYSDSLLQLSSQASRLGSFKPPSWKYDSNHDIDLGSAGPELLPAGIIFQAGKNGIGYLIGASTMSSEAPALYEAQVCGGFGSFGGDAYAAGVIYIPCSNGAQALAYNQSAHTFSPLWKGPSDAKGPPILTAGLVWTVAGGGGATKLYGLEPANGKPRYTLTLPSPVADHFPSPSAASGRLFLATGSTVTAYMVAKPASAGTIGSTESIGASTSGPSGGAGRTGSVLAAGGSAAPEPAPPLLLRTRLHVTAGGRTRLALVCTAAPRACSGKVTLRARFRVRSGPKRVRRVLLITLAVARFGPARGTFTLTLRLGPRGLAHLRAHRGHLAVIAVIGSPGGGFRRVAATLTQGARQRPRPAPGHA